MIFWPMYVTIFNVVGITTSRARSTKIIADKDITKEQ